MTDPPLTKEERKQAVRLVMAWLSLAVFLSAGITAAALYVIEAVETLGVDMDRPVPAGELIFGLALCVPLFVIVFYALITAWMVFARFFFTREEVYTMMTSGVTTAFDHWLFNMIFPDKK